MKRFLGALSGSVAGILTFVFLSIPFMSLNNENETITEATSMNAWDFFNNELLSNMEGYGFLKAFIIISIVLACLIILLSVLSLLKETKIVKTNANFDFFNFLLLILLTVSAIVVIIGISNLGKTTGVFTDEVYRPYKAGVGSILNIVVSALATLVCAIPVFSPSKKKKR